MEQEQEEEKKIYKPESCKKCPVARFERGNIVCGVNKDLKAGVDAHYDQIKMYNGCVIAWDKPEPEENKKS